MHREPIPHTRVAPGPAAAFGEAPRPPTAPPIARAGLQEAMAGDAAVEYAARAIDPNGSPPVAWKRTTAAGVVRIRSTDVPDA